MEKELGLPICCHLALAEEFEDEPAKVTRVPEDAYHVNLPVFSDFSQFMLGDVDITNNIRNVSFSTKRLNLHKFGKSMYTDHAAYYEMSQEFLDNDYQMFYNGLVDNCKELYIKDPVFTVHYDAMRHQDIVSWSVLAGSEQLDYFKNLFQVPPETVYREVEVPVYPQTLRECFKQAWVIIKRRFRHGRQDRNGQGSAG